MYTYIYIYIYIYIYREREREREMCTYSDHCNCSLRGGESTADQYTAASNRSPCLESLAREPFV